MGGSGERRSTILGAETVRLSVVEHLFVSEVIVLSCKLWPL